MPSVALAKAATITVSNLPIFSPVAAHRHGHQRQRHR
jgi:hypothetical protein